MAIRKEEVYEACNRLLSNGVKPTLIKVREELGSGSNSTILRALQEWKEIHKFKLHDKQQKILDDFSEKFVNSLDDRFSEHEQQIEYLLNKVQELNESLISEKKLRVKAQKRVLVLTKKNSELQKDILLSMTDENKTDLPTASL